ncbi:MAG: PAS domain S-box protein, partial [Thermodesulfobacteriota bacterium]|nr:PAS domain S-box protein [Thermodesulfobacteriota bacterium]
LSDWVWETDRYGIYSYVSPSVQQLLGYEPHEIKGSSFCSFLSETTLAKTNGEFEWYVAENEPFKNQVVKVRHKDGSTVTLEVSGQPILNRDGDFGGYRGVSRDISMRIKSEDARRESQKKLDTLMNATTDMAFLVDSAGVLLAVNNALAERFGKRKDELVGQSFFEFSLGEAKTVRMAKLQEMIATKQPLCWEDSYDGWSLENSLYPILDDDGNVVQIAVFSKDITRRKQAEEERERLLQAIDQSSETIVITDSGGTIQYVNPAFTTTSGYTSAEALGQNPRILQSEVHGIKFYETMWKRLTGGEPWSGQLVNKKKDGSVYTEEVTISPVRNRAGETMNYVAVKRDISQELKTEQQRIDLEGQLRQKYKMEAVGVMAGGMAHNFNNNLAIILGHIELLRRRLPQDTDFGKYIDNAKVAALRSKDLIQQIMTYSHRGIHDKVSMQLSPIIEETVQLLRSTLPATINLQQQISRDSRHRSVHADGSQIQECLINLCNNAMHAMNESGDLTIFLETVVLQDSDIPAQYESKPGLYAKMSVQDTGCGMSAETIDKIFDLFFTTKGVDEGTGIGLSTVQGIVNQHGGLVKVSSTLGEGTVFELYFPIIEADQTLDIAADHEDFPEGRERILFVDDEEMLVNLGEEMLSEGGYQVTAMTDSMAALSLFNADPDSFDLIITDQTMPELCGSDLIREVKKRRPELPTILCTGYSNKMTEVQAKQQGISAFSLKPFNLSELLQTVRRVLDGE